MSSKEKLIPVKNVLVVATDGAPSMVGRYRGFLAPLKEVVPDALAVHRTLCQQHLMARRLSARLNSSLQLFRQLWDENDEEFNRLLLHTEMRWLSKGACLTRFYEFFGSVI
ncbi:hypothetical protein M514_00969 [Trichuris suis]|uniref:SCAN domain-containing protein 3 n=1 Tax=Trichuris suis TaxID=68888 RepID=A0A085NLX4_9BILA|nr:hypothetical protein M514_00969 [Trichuris suis]